MLIRSFRYRKSFCQRSHVSSVHGGTTPASERSAILVCSSCSFVADEKCPVSTVEQIQSTQILQGF
ncbi:hypothetical protein J6590_104632 [Homalodisca vitripennis]|nr:hypothetical protein J6590_104632 [Homalodisca vitripennis]